MFSVSAIITTYNRAQFLAETIEAVLAQTLRPMEIIVVDDGSTDETAELLAKYPVRAHRISNMGPSAARAAGLALARGDWIAFCDDDDLWKPGYIEAMSRHLGGGVRFGFANFVEIHDGVWGTRDKFSLAPPGYFESIGDSFYPHLLRWVPQVPSTTIIAASLLREVGGVDPSFGRGWCEDWELELRCVQQGRIAFINEPLVGIRRHAYNMTANRLALLLGNIRVLDMARNRHPAAARYAEVLEERLADNCIEAVDEAFSTGRTDLVRDLARRVPAVRRSWRLRAKRAICTARVPGALLRRLFGH
jgi:glycosyltransferase involved in cell wall biosynthesis